MMGLRSLNLIVNDYCNSRCNCCHIWQNRNHGQITAQDVRDIFSMDVFAGVEDVSITGGEPCLLPDIGLMVETLLASDKHLRRLFFNHNGTMPAKIMGIVKDYAGSVDEFCLSISIEGSPIIHRMIRGIDCYESAAGILKACADLGLPGYRQIISTTFQRINSDAENVQHLLLLAKQTNSGFNYRFVAESPIYYGNKGVLGSLSATREQISQVLQSLGQGNVDAAYLDVQKRFHETGRVPLLQDESGKILCRAGRLFASVYPDGSIYPCIFSTRSIGSIRAGFLSELPDLQDIAPCPCAPTECVIYPMLYHAGE